MKLLYATTCLKACPVCPEMGGLTEQCCTKVLLREGPYDIIIMNQFK